MRRRPGVRSRVLVAMAVPVALLVVASSQLAASAFQTSQSARQVETSVEMIEPLVNLNAALFEERLAVRDVFPDRFTDLTTTEVEIALQRSRQVTDDAIDAAQRRIDDLDIIERDLANHRALQNRNVQLLPFPGRYHNMVDEVDDQMRALIREADIAVRSFDAPEVQQSVQLTEASLDAALSAFETVVQLESYWDAADFERTFILSQLAQSYNDFLRSTDEIERLADDTFDELWASSADGRAELGAIVDDILVGSIPDPAAPTPPLEIVPAAMVELTVRATDHASQSASITADDRRAAAFSQTAIALLFLIATGIGVFLLSRSILRPLRSLSDQARAAADGNLDLVPLDDSSVEELRVASIAFNDLVANLQLTERKIAALGEARLDAAELDESLPGRMGESLQASLTLLSDATLTQDRLRADLEYQATHDSLTGLLKRNSALALLDGIGPDRGVVTSATIVNLRSFKSVNDTYGHRIGDEVLQQLAIRVRSLVPGDAAVARLGGDEFIVIVENTNEEAARTTAHALLSIVKGPFLVSGLTVSVGADVGVAVGDTGGRNLLAGALVAVAEAGRQLDGNLRMFDEELERAQLERAEIEGWLIDVLNVSESPADPAADPPAGAGSLLLEYQPVVNPKENRVVGVEALLRYRNPSGDLVNTQRLIEAAEQSDLILTLGDWVLNEACRQVAEWAEDPLLFDLRVAVNVSAVQLLDPEFPTSARQALRRHGVHPSMLKIEVTETSAITDMQVAAVNLDRLHELGVSISLDDFGTGYTSVAQVRSLPIDELKVDKSLIDCVATDPEDRALVRVVSELAHQIDVDLVAEGVEDLAQLETLVELGFDRIQGWLFSRSLPPTEVAAYVSTFGAEVGVRGVVTTSESAPGPR